ncbi:MAG: tRNA uridine(34) 5-carboxymethylaminomethyl modification radical SAM/GNAT enzyme Elp3 [Methanomassiliicoccales archaeon]
MADREKYFETIVEEIEEGAIRTPSQLEKRKIQLCREYSLDTIPANSEILERIPQRTDPKAIEILRLKPSRTASGIAAVAIMTSPYNCPHGTCIYCPGGVENNSSQAYTGKEPAARRAAMNNFDPFLQAKSRIEQLKAIGHSTDKIELIIMGGTFTGRSKEYQEWFVRRALDALNGVNSGSMEEAQRINETAANRCIGLTIETRPDQLNDEQLDFILSMGATRVEIGVQTLNDNVLRRINRGHDSQSVASSTARARERGFKICYHMMPGLPWSSREMDIAVFRELFENDIYRPDMLKIYPTLVIEGTPLYDMHRRGLYNELTTEEAVSLLAEIKRNIPPYVRIQRIQRDIPANLIEAGVKKSNIRELIREEMERRGWRCRCIRCREVGHLGIDESGIDEKEVELRELQYSASKGKEIFLSFELSGSDAMVGYLRLRLGRDAAAYVRELKVFGRVVPIGANSTQDWQHRGYGRKLLAIAEEIAADSGYASLRIISGIGTREYYRRFGYERDGHYMGKSLRSRSR